MRYIDPTGRITLDQNADAFVDNKRIGLNVERSTNGYHHNAEYAERVCTTLGKMLFSSGGALELLKCYYQMMHWHWDQLVRN